MTIIFRTILLAAAMVMMLASCSSDNKTRVEIGNEKQILHIGNGSEPADVDPHITTGSPESNLQYALFEGLVARDSETLELIPGVAESWEISDDGTIYTFTIRKNARWSNGDPLTAADYVWSWKRALLPELGNEYAYSLYPIKNAELFNKGTLKSFDEVGVKAIDDQTLQVELVSPTPYFLEIMDHHSSYAVHRATIEKFGAAGQRNSLWTRPKNFVGNGPFVMKHWSPNEVIVVEKNLQYWDADTVKLNEIHFYPIEENSTEERMFRSGQLHITYKFPSQKIETYKRERPEVLRSFPFFGTYFYLLNVAEPPLDDVRVRQALAYSIDRSKITEYVTKGGERPTFNLTPPDTNGYTAQAKLSYDVERAQQLLADAGYPNGQGFPELTLLYNTDELHQQVAVTIQQMWREALGINITLINQDWKVFLANKRTRNFQMARFGWIGDYYDPTTFLNLFISDNGNNDSNWSSEEYDQLLLKAEKTVQQDVRYGYLQQAEAILVQEVPFVPIYTYAWNRAVKPSVKNWHDNMKDRWSFKNVYLEPQTKQQP